MLYWLVVSFVCPSQFPATVVWILKVAPDHRLYHHVWLWISYRLSKFTLNFSVALWFTYEISSEAQIQYFQIFWIHLIWLDQYHWH
jgi:hypothetical protein